MNALDEKTVLAPQAHHPRGMSGWPAVLACPCFTSKGESKDSAMGTACHSKLAEWLNAYRKTGSLPDVDRSELSLHEAGAYRAAEYVAYALELAKLPPDRLWVEYRCTLDDGVFGTADAVWVNPAALTVNVVDFKTFRNPGRDYFPQLLGYGLAIAEGLVGSVWAGKERDVSIVCNVLYGDSKEVDQGFFMLCDARATRDSAMASYDLRDSGDGKPTQCNWCELCAHHATCPAVSAAIAELKDGVAAKQVETWGLLAPARKAQLLVIAEFAMKWADAVRAKAKADALAGEVLEDAENGIAFTLRESAGRKKPRVADLWPVLAAHGVEPEAFKAKLAISATDAEGLLKERGVKAKEAKALVADVCDVGAGSVSLVRA